MTVLLRVTAPLSYPVPVPVSPPSPPPALVFQILLGHSVAFSVNYFNLLNTSNNLQFHLVFHLPLEIYASNLC